MEFGSPKDAGESTLEALMGPQAAPPPRSSERACPRRPLGAWVSPTAVSWHQIHERRTFVTVGRRAFPKGR